MGPPHWTAVTTPGLIGVLAWWAVVLAAPLFLLRRWRRRRLARQSGDFGVPQSNAHADPTTSPDRAPKEARTSPLMPVRGEAPLSERSGVGVSPAALEPLCRYVDFRRRLEQAVGELERRLAFLPRDRWRIEPYPLTGERRNTLMLLGATGVFVISATLAPGSWDDVSTVSRLARKIQSLLPGYAGEVHGAICHPFSSTQPRQWHRADADGDWVDAWLVGADSVVEWIEHFGSDHGLSVADLAHFDRLAKPNWLRPAIPTPSTWPPLPDTRNCPPQ